MENHHLEWEKTINVPFLIAMLNYQRVYVLYLFTFISASTEVTCCTYTYEDT